MVTGGTLNAEWMMVLLSWRCDGRREGETAGLPDCWRSVIYCHYELMRKISNPLTLSSVEGRALLKLEIEVNKP